MIVLLAISSALAQAAGSITVASEPSGLPVLLDGSPTERTTPTRLFDVPEGPHIVSVAQGCLVGTTTVEVARGRTAKVKLLAVQAMGTLELSVTPEDAALRIDGAALAPGVSTLAIGCGEHKLLATRDGYVASLVPFEVLPNQIVTLNVALDAIGHGRLKLVVEPREAELLLDGKPLDPGARRTVELPAGPHILEARLDGYAPQKRQLVVNEDELTELTLRLAPAAAAAAAEPAPPPPQPPPLAPAPVVQAPAPEASAREPIPLGRWAGYGLGAAGIGVGVLAGVQFARTADAYGEYAERVEEVDADPELPEAHATAWYRDEVLPNRSRARVLTGLSAALLAGGVTLTVAF